MDSHFYIIYSLSFDVSLELNAYFVVAWMYTLHRQFYCSTCQYYGQSLSITDKASRFGIF